MTGAEAGALRRALLRWYRRNRRDLPWRRTASPYRTWISEIMLQQTTVAAVVPRYEAFLKRFPDAASLARARSAPCLHWAVSAIIPGAQFARPRRVVARHGGEFPGSYEEALALPGIGRYTAGAILSIAFGRRLPVVDGNVIRVFSRIFAVETPVERSAPLLWKLASELVPGVRPGDWNQALMELGATVCLPASPSCGTCPVAGLCRARNRGIQESLPKSASRKAAVKVRWTCLWIEKNGKVLLWRRGADEALLRDLWGLPESRRLAAAPGRLLGKATHSITHHRLGVEVRESVLKGPPPPQARWVPKNRLGDYLVSSLWEKCLPR